MNENKCGALREFVARVEGDPRYVDGALSFDYGFLPKVLPAKQLPPQFRAWDDLAARLPELNTIAGARSALARLPQLDAADHTLLPDSDLARASTILSQLALGWWRGEPERFFAARMSSVDAHLPDTILVPWRQVTRRLGRGDEPYQSGYDLFLNNFRLRNRPHTPEYDLSELRIENLDALVPSFANQPERVFYMAFVEMMAHCAPMIAALCEMEECMETGTPRPARVAELLDALAAIVEKCTIAFKKVAPYESSKTWCDPILWAKTVAIFAVPIKPWRQGGTSGAFVPLFLTLDELIGRSSYHSYYGEYVKGHAPGLLPDYILDFNRKVGALNLRGWIAENRDTSDFERVVRSYDHLIEVYAGEEGYLGRHVSKVLNYLAVATMVGRNQSTSGDERFTHEHTWMEVASHLNAARDERYRLRFTPASPQKGQRASGQPQSRDRLFSELEVAKSSLTARPLHILHDAVYDLNDFMRRHVGGVDIIRCYAGLDATRFFALAVEHERASIQKQMAKYHVGLVGERFGRNDAVEDTAQAGGAPSRRVALLQLVIYCRNIMQRHCASTTPAGLGPERASAVSPAALAEQRRLFVRHAHQQFVCEHLPAIVATWGGTWPGGDESATNAGNFAAEGAVSDEDLLPADVNLLEAMIEECLRCFHEDELPLLGPLLEAAAHI